MRSVNDEVHRLVDRAAEGSFLTTDDGVAATGGPRHAVHQALLRDVAVGYLIHVRRGLFWKPAGRRRAPHPSEVASAIARITGLADGSGPTGDAARWLLGLAELPATWVETVSGRPPSGLPGLRFVGRQGGNRSGLTRREVAALELLRDGPLPRLSPAIDLGAVARAAMAERSAVVRGRGHLLLERTGTDSRL